MLIPQRYTRFIGFSLVILSVFVSGCDNTPTTHRFSGQAQGTTYQVLYWQSAAAQKEDKIVPETLKPLVDDEIARIDHLMSNYRDDSVIAVFNATKIANRPIQLDAEILALLTKSKAIYQQSNGCYDPTISPLFKLWGFTDKSLNIPSDEQIDETMNYIGFNQFIWQENTLTKPHPQLTIDLSAIGQGYAISQIAQLLDSKNINNYLIEIGGEMLVKGNKPDQSHWRIGVEKPVPNEQTLTEVIEFTGSDSLAVMTSGTYRHYYDQDGKAYSHIIDPRSGRPVTHDTVSVVTLLPDAALSDAWSTALLCLGSDDGLKIANQHNIPAIFYRLDNNNQLIRQTSDAINQENAPWRIQ